MRWLNEGDCEVNKGEGIITRQKYNNWLYIISRTMKWYKWEKTICKRNIAQFKMQMTTNNLLQWRWFLTITFCAASSDEEATTDVWMDEDQMPGDMTMAIVLAAKPVGQSPYLLFCATKTPVAVPNTKLWWHFFSYCSSHFHKTYWRNTSTI